MCDTVSVSACPENRTENFFDQSHFDVRFDWGMEGLMRLVPDARVVVIVDVLSFTTSVEVATSRGAVILPYPVGRHDLVEYAVAHDAHVAGDRNSDTKSSWSLSPASLTTIPEDMKLVLPSPNGSALSFWAAETGTEVLAGCLRNASAVARAIRSGPPIAVVAAGERSERSPSQSRFALEDQVGAGAIIAALESLDRSPEAASAEASFRASPSISETLRNSGSGRELIERGFTRDLDLAAGYDVSRNVPILTDGAFRKNSI